MNLAQKKSKRVVFRRQTEGKRPVKSTGNFTAQGQRTMKKKAGKLQISLFLRINLEAHEKALHVFVSQTYAASFWALAERKPIEFSRCLCRV